MSGVQYWLAFLMAIGLGALHTIAATTLRAESFSRENNAIVTASDVFRMPHQIESVASDGARIFVATSGRLFCRDLRSHKTVWSASVELLDDPKDSNLATDGGLLFDLEQNRTITARVAATGTRLWTVSLPFARSVETTRGSLFVYGQALAKIDEARGVVTWALSKPGDAYGRPIVDQARVAVEQSSGGGFIAKSTLLLDAESGKIIAALTSTVPGIFLEPLAFEGPQVLTYYTSGTSDISQLSPKNLAARIQRNDRESGRFVELDDYQLTENLHGSASPATGIFVSDDVLALDVGGETYLYDVHKRVAPQKPVSVLEFGHPIAIADDELTFSDGKSIRVASFTRG